jgi:glycosyltransferase involved in cell wall biosynthesis
MATQADAVMVVGQGVAQALGLQNHPRLKVETASWIDASLIASDAALATRCAATQQHAAASACFAGRLEPMKGAHVGIEALALMAPQLGAATPPLSIFGQGPAESDLRALAQARRREHAGVDVRFEGTRAYPHEFLQAIAAFDLVLMTNLNDEQPRLVFDAISQGVIPLCPRHAHVPRVGPAR